MPKLSFISDELIRIELDEGTWVDIRREMSYEEYASILEGYKDDSDKSEKAKIGIRLLEKAVVAWSDPEHACVPENIGKLSIPVINILASKIMELYNTEKKSSQS